MSNIAVFNPAKAPAHIRKGKGLSTLAKTLAGGGDSGKRISIKGGVFRLISSGKEVAAIDDRHLDVVIVAAAEKINRQYYATKFDSANPAPPDCWSADGITPSSESNAPQAKSCASCPMNIAGSGNGNSRACKYQQRLAVVLANDMNGDIMQLALPSTSIFGKDEGDDKRPLQAYARWLAAQDISPEEVVTRMRFDTASESPKLFFKPARWLDEAEAELVADKATHPDAIKAISMEVFKTDKVAAPAEATLGARPTKAAKPAPEPEVEAEEEAPAPKAAAKKSQPKVEEVDEAPEPTVRKEEKKPNAVPAKKNLASMVDDWDDE